MLGSTIILIIGFIILGFAGKNHTLLLLGTILRSIGVGPIFAVIYALVADTCDYGEWKTDIHSEGLISSSQSIGSKIGIATALTQSQDVISGIIFVFSWLGAIFSIFLFICVLFMDVEKYLPQIQTDLSTSKS